MILAGYIKLARGFMGSRISPFFTSRENSRPLYQLTGPDGRDQLKKFGLRFPEPWMTELTSLLLSCLIYKTRMLNLIIKAPFQVENSVIFQVVRIRHTPVLLNKPCWNGISLSELCDFLLVERGYLNWIQLKPCLRQWDSVVQVVATLCPFAQSCYYFWIRSRLP